MRVHEGAWGHARRRTRGQEQRGARGQEQRGARGQAQRGARGQAQRGALRAGDWGLARRDAATRRQERRSPVSGPERPAAVLTMRRPVGIFKAGIFRTGIFAAAVARGFASALLLIIAAFVISMKFRELGHLLLAPGDWLVQVSNWICPPLGVECVLGSKRQGMQHIWQILCAYAAWSALFSAAWWYGLRRARPQEAEQASIFLKEGKGLS